MNAKLSVIIGMGLSLYLPSLQAATISSIRQLPTPIQTCVITAECLVGFGSDFELGGIAAFRYSTKDFSGYLFRYSVLKPSAATYEQNYVDDAQNPPITQLRESNIPLKGHVWLQVAERYSNSATGLVALYSDKITPTQVVLPRFFDPIDPPTIHFQLTPKSLLASRAYSQWTLTEQGGTGSGDLIAAEPPLLICLANGCSVREEINLIGMTFVESGNELVLQFAPHDRRQMLYNEERAYDDVIAGFHEQYQLYVQPVPLPAAWQLWLLSLSLFAGGQRITSLRKRLGN
jgi:hypothetical protein